MTLCRVFVDPRSIQGSRLRIEGRDAFHMARVLRMSRGDRFIAADGSGVSWEAEVSAVIPGPCVEASLTRELHEHSEPRCKVTLYQAIPKSDKMDVVVQKCTELGVHAIVPLVTQRTICRPEGRKRDSRVERWRRIAREAAAQSGRLVVPGIYPPLSLDECAPDRNSPFLVLWEGGPPPASARRLKDALPGSPPCAAASVLVGPEGGLTEAEVRLMESRGAVAVSLGSRVLRTETAGIVAVALILHGAGDLG
ncbi:MAG: 16S rRNA (uracil(1498)-N(3))-methyltransferase [Firmicutes bacterium]|jgi:16S rRNA (uracil1498-N3)-methyltransferase|nr:16S rRNA (uracil(1498)-N(3))-methyltransferase [Bacillota bacterium]